MLAMFVQHNAGTMSIATSTMMQLLSGYFYSQTLYVVARLGVADVLKDGPRSVTEIASKVGAHTESLYRVLRALSVLGIFEEQEGRTFALTALSSCLRSDIENSLRPVALMTGAPWHWKAWGALLEAVQEGSSSAFEHGHEGVSLFEHFEGHAAASTLFEQVMGGPPEWSQAIVAAYSFPPSALIVDIGGASGTLAHAILNEHPEARAVVYDRPSVVEGHEHTDDALSVRCEHVGGDFFKAVPTDGDVYVLRFIVHDWSDEEALQILERCRSAMAPGGRVLVIEKLLGQSATTNADAALFDVTMMVLTGGRERTTEEVRVLLERAGLEWVQIIPTRAGLYIIEARAAKG